MSSGMDYTLTEMVQATIKLRGSHNSRTISAQKTPFSVREKGQFLDTFSASPASE